MIRVKDNNMAELQRKNPFSATLKLSLENSLQRYKNRCIK